MNRTLLTIAFVAAAGTAGAQTVTTPAGSVNAGAGSATSGAATMTAPPAGAGATMNNGATMNSNAGMRGAQAGGGAQMNTNSQMNTNAQMPNGQVSNGPMNGNMGANGSAGASANANMANASTERMTGAAGTAQKRIEQDGYRSVQNLQKGADGLWHGDAMRGNAKVQVTVDRAGRVSAQ
jgi:hypothetical protein